MPTLGNVSQPYLTLKIFRFYYFVKYQNIVKLFIRKSYVGRAYFLKEGIFYLRNLYETLQAFLQLHLNLFYVYFREMTATSAKRNNFQYDYLKTTYLDQTKIICPDKNKIQICLNN